MYVHVAVLKETQGDTNGARALMPSVAGRLIKLGAPDCTCSRARAPDLNP